MENLGLIVIAIGLGILVLAAIIGVIVLYIPYSTDSSNQLYLKLVELVNKPNMLDQLVYFALSGAIIILMAGAAFLVANKL